MIVLLLRKLTGAVLFVGGVYVGLVAFFADEPWADNVLVRYGGAILAWGVAGAGIMLWNSTRHTTRDEETDENSSGNGP